MIADRGPVTSGFIEMLERGTNAPVGDHEIPELQSRKPWAIVYAIDGGGYSGPPLTSPEADAQFVYQVTSSGLSREQVDWMADTVRRTVLARTPSGAFQVAFPFIEVYTVKNRHPDSPPGQLEIEGPPEHRVYSIPERFVLSVTPK